MGNFLETFLSGVAVLAVSGLAWLAYKHPKTFSRLFVVRVNLMLGIPLAIGAVWNIALLTAKGVLFEFVTQDKVEAYKAAAQSIMVPNWALFGFSGITFYISVLYWIISNIEREKKPA